MPALTTKRKGKRDMSLGPDQYLSDALRYLQRTWWRPEVGIVVAGLIEEGRPPVFATSTRVSQGCWRHAERNVLSKFEQRYGPPNPRSLLVSSLSPCLRSSQSREGASCTQLIVDHGLTTVHAGVIDLGETIDGVEIYAKRGITITVTSNPLLSETCKYLFDLFEEYGDRINDDLRGIKTKLGDEFAARLVTP